MMVTLRGGKLPEVVKWGEELLLARTSPKEGGGAPSEESLRAGQAGAPATRVGGSGRLLAGRLGGMTSSLPRSATEALLF